MLRNLLATTAITALLATGAMAQTASDPAAPATTAPAQPAATVQAANGYLATKVIGESVYNGTGDKAENIGDVNDIVIGKDGQIANVVVGVGGFLGMGEKNVAVNWKDLSWAEKNGDRWLVMATSKDALQAMPTFDPKPYEPAAQTAAAAPATGDQTMAPADTASNNTAAKQDTVQTGAIDKSTLTPFDTSSVRAEDIVGTTVYGADDKNVGKIGDVVLSQDGKVDSILMDVGGFLGLGAKEVAVGMDKLSFMTDKDGSKYLYTSLTKEQLEAQPAYDKSTWADKRDEQRLIVQ